MKTRLSSVVILTVILATGFGLRVHQLGALGIWGDEAFSIAVGKMSLPQIVEGGRDTLPPLFHILLHFWMLGTGTSEFSARYLALMAGMLLIPATFVVARRLLNPAAAYMAAALITLSPFAVYYSQEARMYSQQAALFMTLSVYGFLRLHEQSQRLAGPNIRRFPRWQVVYLIATLGAMYSHYYVFFIIAAQNVYALWRWRRQPRWLAWWIGTQLLLAILYLPWVFAQVGYLSGKANRRWEAWGPSGMIDVWVNTLIAFGVGTTVPTEIHFMAIPMLILAMVGLAFVLRPTRWFPSPLRHFTALYLLLPMLIAWAVGPIMPFFYTRFLLPILPAYVMLLAAGFTGFWLIRRRELALLSLALVIAAQAPALSNLNRSPQYAKSGYREVMALISAQAQPGDALLLLNPEQDALYAYYGDKALPAYWFPPNEGWDSPKNQRRMSNIQKRYQRVWLILFGNARDWDPANNLQNWLNQHAFRTYHTGYIDGGLDLYILGDVQPTTAFSADFGGLIRLTGYGISANSISPGGTIQIALGWEALAQPDKNYTIFTHIVDGQQHIVGQFDGPPGAGTHPTSSWRPGEKSTDRFAIQIDPSTAPGTYWLQVGWYDLSAPLERLPVTDAQGQSLGDKAILIPIEVK